MDTFKSWYEQISFLSTFSETIALNPIDFKAIARVQINHDAYGWYSDKI